MISLITGVPGSGKTAWLVYQLMTRADLKDRPLYVFNIPDLKVPHEKITEEQARTWPEWAPTGALFVMDECQKVFRPRRSGSDVPAYVSEFETTVCSSALLYIPKAFFGRKNTLVDASAMSRRAAGFLAPPLFQ